MERKRILNFCLAVAVVTAGVTASIKAPDDKADNPSANQGASECSGDIDCGLPSHSCMIDAECNPGVADPERWIYHCSDAEEASQAQASGGNMTGTCVVNP
jgi:hypothetical protein